MIFVHILWRFILVYHSVYLYVLRDVFINTIIWKILIHMPFYVYLKMMFEKKEPYLYKLRDYKNLLVLQIIHWLCESLMGACFEIISDIKYLRR